MNRIDGCYNAPIVTVFGGTGFLGRYVIWQLARQGFVIRIPTRDPNRVLSLTTSGVVGQIVAIPTNIHKQSSIEKAIQGSDYVVNLIGILFEKGKRQNFKKIHVDFPAALGAIAAQKNVKQIVHVSALGANLFSSSLYACTKATGEIVLRNSFPNAVILRPSVLFGDEDNFINKFAQLARWSPILPLIGGGTTLFQPAYVGDVAHAVVRAFTDPKAAGKIYSLTGPFCYSFEELLEYIANITGQKRFLFPVPFGVAKVMAWILEKFPTPLLTRDQIELLKTDNISAEGDIGFAELGILPSSLEAIAPHYLYRYRVGGRFARAKTKIA